MFTVIRTVTIPSGGSFTQIEGVYCSREEAESVIPLLQKIVENPNRMRMSYNIN